MKKLGFIAIGVFLAMVSSQAFAEGRVSYTLHKSDNPNEDEQDAYSRIKTVMDSAVYIYNKYTNLSKFINVYYAPGVPTAEASSNGDLRFGSERSYMFVGTALHEMGHTMGMGTTTEYKNMIVNGVFQGERAQALVKELDGPDAELHGDGQHFWPYGLNYASEVKSEQDLINHARIVEAMYQDIFKEVFYKSVVVATSDAKKCMGRTANNTLEIMDCSAEGAKANIFSIGDNPVTYRIEFGDRVIDIPNESTAAGIAAGTYGWNGGAHQRYTFEVAEETGTPNTTACYLKNYKSKLYLEADGSQIVQNNNKYTWLLIETVGDDASTPKDSAHITPEAPKDTAQTTPDTSKDTTQVNQESPKDTAQVDNKPSKDSTTTEPVVKPNDTKDTSTIVIRRVAREPSVSNVSRAKFDLKGRHRESSAHYSRWNIIFMK